MKVFKILSHPYTLIICFLMILISGEHLGGFYILYLLLALPHGAIHSILALAGIGVLLFTFYRFQRKKVHRAEILLNVLGLALLFLSIYLFFANDKQHYNFGTFEQVVPVSTLFFTGVIATLFLTDNLSIGPVDMKMREV
jgi:TRAP-type uncharacterized transport system fused permease subunit